MVRPPPNKDHVYWTNPEDQKEYIVTKEDQVEYEKMIKEHEEEEKRLLKEAKDWNPLTGLGVTMEGSRPRPRVSPGKPNPRFQISRRRGGAFAPSEADIGGLVI